MTRPPPPRSGTTDSGSAAAPDSSPADNTMAVRVLRSEDVLRGQRAVEILHAGVRYRLSVTSLGKLILTK